MLLTKNHIKERRKRRQWVRPWIRYRDSKGAYYSIINDLKLTDKEDFRNYCNIKIAFRKIMCFHFFCTVRVDTVYQKVYYNSCLLLFLRHGIQKTKENFLHKSGFILIYSKKKKKKICIMNKIKLVWFYSLYRFFFWVKMWSL